MSLIDFDLDGYDYLTFAILLLVVIAFFYVMVTLGGLPGKMAERRNHPHAESVKLGGWIGLFTVFPWIHALIWAYHDSLTIDIRKLPKGSTINPGPEGDEDVPAKLEAGIAPTRPSEPGAVEPGESTTGVGPIGGAV